HRIHGTQSWRRTQDLKLMPDLIMVRCFRLRVGCLLRARVEPECVVPESVQRRDQTLEADVLFTDEDDVRSYADHCRQCVCCHQWVDVLIRFALLLQLTDHPGVALCERLTAFQT